MSKQIYIYDTTLRDGAQTHGVHFRISDKIKIAKMLIDFGVDYIEGGFPGSNEADKQFFDQINSEKVTSFGMTKRFRISAENDINLKALIECKSKICCIVGKSSSFQVYEALGIKLEENLSLIRDSVEYLVKNGKDVFFDAEHFFDGFDDDEKYSLECIKIAIKAGAKWVILCDTNGGSLPLRISKIVEKARNFIGEDKIGVHLHNDTGCAVANTMAALDSGASQIQGTINGLGERCGNANLCSIIPNIILKTNYKTSILKENLPKIRNLSRELCNILNKEEPKYDPYIGTSAFAHKGGLHISSIAKNSKTYEHIDPSLVGNERVLVVSNQSGKAAIENKIKSLGLKNVNLEEILKIVKEKEMLGYTYDMADSSLSVLILENLCLMKEFFKIEHYRVLIDSNFNHNDIISEATVKLKINDERDLTVSEGNGPVDALSKAMIRSLKNHISSIKEIELTDYKVNILSNNDNTSAITRVKVESMNKKTGTIYNTIGVSSNIIEASFEAINDAIKIFCYDLRK